MSGYVIEVRPGELDLTEFSELAAAGRMALREGNPPLASKMLRSAVELWRGRLLEDTPLSPQLEASVTALDDQHVTVLNDLAAARLELGEHEEIVRDLRELVAAWPLSERTWYHLMLALYRSGRQADALQAYMQARQAIVTQIGVEPSSQLRDTHAAILAGDAKLMSGSVTG